jgi:hypothetical protein
MGKHRFFGLFAPWILLATVVCVPIVFSYAGKSVKDHANRVEDWLPGRYIETQQLSWFRQQFVADQFVVVSWDGCRLGGDPGDPDAEPDDPRIEQFARLMVPSLASGEAAGSASEPAEKTAGESQGVAERPASQVPQSSDTSAPNPNERDYFKEVTTARQVISQLTAPPTSLSYQQAVDRLKGTLVGPDGRQTCVVLAISESGAAHLREAIGRGIQGRRLVKRAEGELFRRARTMGLMPETIRLGGPPVDNVAIDEEGERTLLRLSSFAGLLGLILCWWSLRSVRLTVIVFCCAVLSAAVGLAIVGLTGQSTDAVLMSMPSLVYVLSISGAVHLINHYREALTEFGPEGAVERAIGHGWKPALICSITTALGLISLCTSELTPIRKFGLYSALGVMGMLAVLFLVLPAGLEVWHKRRIVAQMRRARSPCRRFAWIHARCGQLRCQPSVGSHKSIRGVLAVAGRGDHPPSRTRLHALHALHRGHGLGRVAPEDFDRPAEALRSPRADPAGLRLAGGEPRAAGTDGAGAAIPEFDHDHLRGAVGARSGRRLDGRPAVVPGPVGGNDAGGAEHRAYVRCIRAGYRRPDHVGGHVCS